MWSKGELVSSRAGGSQLKFKRNNTPAHQDTRTGARQRIIKIIN